MARPHAAISLRIVSTFTALPLAIKFLATKGTKEFLDAFVLLCLLWLAFLVLFAANLFCFFAAVLSFHPQPYARVAQWIRAFASGAKGRRFDPCRGYSISPYKSLRTPRHYQRSETLCLYTLR